MKQKRTIAIILFAAFALLLAACGGRAYGTSGWTGLTTTKDTIYLAETNFVYGINVNNGTEKWRYPQKADNTKTFYSAPVLTDNGQLLAASYDHRIYSLNPATGVENTGGGWPFTGAGSRYLASPLVYKGNIYAANSDGKLYALDQTGKLLWTYPNKGALGPLWSTPAVDSTTGTLYLSSMDHYVYAINSSNGSAVWKSNLKASLAGTPALSDGKLYVGTFDSKIYALDAQTGKQVWATPADLKSGWVWSSPAMNNNRLYVGDNNGNFYVISSTDGKVIKQSQPNGPIIDTPAVAKQAIYFGGDNGAIYAIDQDGNVLWNKPIGGNIYTTPGLVYDSNNNLQLILAAPVDFKEALLVALAPDQTQKWAFQPK